jgi:hypothetical protein
MLPIYLSQIILASSVFGLTFLVVRKFPDLRAIELSKEEQEKFLQFINLKTQRLLGIIRVAYYKSKRIYLKLLARVLHRIKILSLKLDAHTTVMLHKVKSKPDIDIQKLNNQDLEINKSNSENDNGNGAFFESLKEIPKHRRLSGKLKNIKKEIGEE